MAKTAKSASMQCIPRLFQATTVHPVGETAAPGRRATRSTARTTPKDTISRTRIRPSFI